MDGETDEFLNEDPTSASVSDLDRFGKLNVNIKRKSNRPITCGVGRAASAYAIVVGLMLIAVLVIVFGNGSESEGEVSSSEDETSVALDADDHPNMATPGLEPSGENIEEHDIAQALMHAAFTNTTTTAEADAAHGGNKSDFVEVLDWYRTIKSMQTYADECDAELAKYKPGTYMHERAKADCGAGYTMPNPVDHTNKTYKVALVGRWTEGIRELAGCKFGFSCPMSPKCDIVEARKPDHVRDANVLLVIAFNSELVHGLHRRKDQHRVLYWREGMWVNVPNARQQWENFDLEMGVHYYAGINNPNFVLQPSFLQKGLYQDVVHSEFAASVISDCKTLSRRQAYLDQLAKAVGHSRIHQFGACGNRNLPGRPLNRALAILARYKFFLSFENTIQRGYTSEKLFTSLLLPSIPVYYGDPLVTNITVTPSFIKASDFPNPHALGKYLLFLNENNDEYEKYHAWRKIPEAFTMEYLQKLQHLPGPREVMMHEVRRNTWLSPRHALCCRLCNEAYLTEMSAKRTHHDLMNKTYQGSEIGRRFYAGGAN